MTSVDREAQQQALAELIGGALPLPAEPIAPPVLRDDKGRFLPGGPGGPGRKPGRGVDVKFAAERIARERGIELSVAVGEVVLRLIELAKGGDVPAAALLLKTVGTAEPDGQQGLVVQVISRVPRPDSSAVGVRVITRIQGDHDPDND